MRASAFRLLSYALEPDRVYAWPLYVPGADGTPCTVVAELPR